MNVLSLFSGIGGLDLGLERAGMTVVGQVEIDPWCRKVLAKHWPEVPRHDDVRTCAEWWLVADTVSPGLAQREGQRGDDGTELPATQRSGDSTRSRTSRGRPRVDLVCGGFPCQPVSLAGKGLAQADSRWLWPAFAGVIRALRPGWVLVENVPGLLGRGMGDVLGDLAGLGYDAEWDCVPAVFVGAPHIRNRVWIVAYPNGRGQQERPQLNGNQAPHPADGNPRRQHANGRRHQVALADCEPLVWTSVARRQRHPWPVEPGVGRVAHGIPARVDRLRGLGNAVVPQVAEHIGCLILAGAA